MSESQPQLTAEIKSPLVITDGDEGVQINTGNRFAFLGAGWQLPMFTQALQALRQVLQNYPSKDKKLRLVASEENAYFRQQLQLNDWDETNASMQQHLAALADKEKLLYSGILPFADPVDLEHGVKGHMVRPHDVHIANKICFTLAGGETVYNLGQYLISADWLLAAPKKVAEQLIKTQLEFYRHLAKNPNLDLVVQSEGPLGEAVANKNLKILQSLGLKINL